MANQRLIIVFLFFAVIALPGCTVKAALDSPEPSSFITRPELLAKTDDVPFDLFWSSPEVSSWLFDTVIIEQVNIEQVQAKDWFYSSSAFIRSEESYIERVFELSLYLESSLAKAFRASSKRKSGRKIAVEQRQPQAYYNMSRELFPQSPVPLPLYDPVERGGRTLLVYVALSEVTFGDPLLYAGLFAVPVPGVANLSTAVRAASVVFKAKFIDRESGKVVMELIDRRFPQLKIIDLNRLVIGSDLRKITDSFVKDLTALFFRSRGVAIKRRSPVSILPW